METDLSLFLTALINHPVRLATSALLMAGTVYVAGSIAGFSDNSSMVSGLILGSLFTYSNTVNIARRERHHDQEVSFAP